VHIVSDRRERVAATLVVRLLDFDGAELWRNESFLEIDANRSRAYFSHERAAILADAAPQRAVLAADVMDGSHRLSRSLHHFVRPKDLELPDPELTVLGPRALELETQATGRGAAHTPAEGNDCEQRYDMGSPALSFRVEAKKFAKNVRLAAGASRGRFSDNYFDLLPGEAVTVAFYGTLVGEVSATSLRDTY
jgi:beta-mannosidase